MSVFTLEELQKMDKNELITIIGNYISDQEIWLNKAKELEKQKDKKSAEIERLTEKDNEKNERSPFLMCEDYDAYLESMSNTELLEYFHFVMGNYKHSLDKVTLENTELQKQVDELKEEKLSAICDLNMRIVELDNELKQAKTLLEFREETIKYLEDANIRYAKALENKVKDTAKEIFGEQKKFICSKWKQYMTENELIEFAEERYGVEVE